jgi:hypothetical protein
MLGFEQLADGVVAVRFTYEGDDAPCFVVVARYPRQPEFNRVQPHPNLRDSTKQFVLGTSFAHELDAFDPEDTVSMKLMRGLGVLPKVYDLVSLSS